MPIQITNLNKSFKLYQSHKQRVLEAFHPFRKTYHHKFHALKDISLTIVDGDTVGIIGQNGSGKSTLLQIICGILTPDSGDVVVDGRISALLELGAGFNPEFSGRENVFLNGAILGFSRADMEACFDDIIAFAEIGEFIDQPVKTYSSGMYVRLAFAVAINVKPDILIVDEALSVGDILFQAKCFAKFKEFQDNGVTILFVTHSLDLITRYCNRAILLERGELISQGSPKTVVDVYNRLLVKCSQQKRNTPDTTSTTVEPNTSRHESRYGTGKATIADAGIFDMEGRGVQTLTLGSEYEFRFSVEFTEEVSDPVFSYTIKDVTGFNLTGTNTLFKEVDTGYAGVGDKFTICFRQKIMLAAGGYLLSFGCAGFEDGGYVVYERRYDVLDFQVVAGHSIVGLFDSASEVTFTKIE